MASLQALQSELQSIASRVQGERISEDDRTRFNQYLHLFHQTRQTTHLPSMPTYGDKRPDLLLLYKTVREQYGSVSEMDMEDWLSVARLLKLRVHTVTNGLRLLKEFFDHLLAPIDDPKTSVLSQPAPPPVAQTTQGATLLFVPEVKISRPAGQAMPAVHPYARLDLQRILLGLEDLEISAFQNLDGLLVLVAEGRWPEPRREEISRCKSAVERVIGKSRKFPILLNHALHSLSLLLSRGVQEETIGNCTEIFSDFRLGMDTRILAGKVLTLVEGLPKNSSVLREILETTLGISEPELFPIVITILARNVHALVIKDVIGIFRKFPTHVKDVRFIGLGLLLIGSFAEEISRSSEGIAAVGLFVVKPVMDEISDLAISDPLWEAGVSLVLKVGVHPELRKALEISHPQIVRMCWAVGESSVAVRSLWNVVTELLVD